MKLKINNKRQASSEHWISLTSLVVLTLFFCTALIQHGLFFRPEYLAFGGILYAIAALILLWGRIPSHPAFYALIIFIILYFLATIHAINLQESLAASFRIAIVIPLVLIAVQLTKEHALALVRLIVYICSGWVICGVLLNQFRGGRFEGTLEYANTSGILLLTALILAIMLAGLENKIQFIWLCSLLTSGILLSGSRTVLVLLFVTVPVLYLAFGKGNRRNLLHVTIAIGIGMIIPFAVVITGLFFYFNEASLLQRLTHLTPHASEWTARLGYYRDAWLMILDSPIFGYGGGAWNILQYHYQTAAYSVRHLHNHWLETWIETGLVGVLLFMSIVLLFIWKGVTVSRSLEGSEKMWTAGCLTAFGCLLAHSTVDFTFNYPLLFCLWVLLGLFIPLHKNDSLPEKELQNSKWPLRIMISTVLILLSFFSIRLSLSESLISQAEQVSNKDKNVQLAIQLLERSASLSFVPAEQHTSMAYLLLEDYLKTKNPLNLNRAAIEINDAFSMNPRDVHVLFLRCQIEYALGNKTKAILELQKLKQLFPFRSDIQTELEKWERTR